jgi:hypothetical protein
MQPVTVQVERFRAFQAQPYIRKVCIRTDREARENSPALSHKLEVYPGVQVEIADIITI